jgi:hypothetical protein
MRTWAISTGVVVLLLLGVMGAASANPLSAPFDTEPFDTDCTGNCASNYLGAFRRDGVTRFFLDSIYAAIELLQLHR